MKILFVITGLGMGGAEKVVVTLADFLTEKGHIVGLVYITGPKIVSPLNKNIEIWNLEVKSKLGFIGAFLRLRAVIQKFSPDILHSHMIHANIICRLQRLFMKIPRLISTAHNTVEGGKLRTMAYRFTDHLADISTNVSDESVKAFFLTKASKLGRMIPVHNGIDINEFSFDSLSRVEIRKELGIRDDCLLLLAVGRLTEAKDYTNMIAAFDKLSKTDINFEVLVVGDGPLKNQILELIKNAKLTSKIRFLGTRNDVSALMSAADVFVLSSAWEGFPMVILEAMACERVVVATDCGGIREALEMTDFLVQPKNPILLAHAIEKVCRLTVNERFLIGQSARQRIVENFSMEIAAEKWLAIYKSGTIL